jgi:hypothetical protein
LNQRPEGAGLGVKVSKDAGCGLSGLIWLLAPNGLGKAQETNTDQDALRDSHCSSILFSGISGLVP